MYGTLITLSLGNIEQNNLFAFNLCNFNITIFKQT